MPVFIRCFAYARGWRSQQVFFVNTFCAPDLSAAWTLRLSAQRTPRYDARRLTYQGPVVIASKQSAYRVTQGHAPHVGASW